MKKNGLANVAVIGLGAMGSALAAAFLKRGVTTIVWNRSPAKADALVEKGAARAPTVADAVARSRLAIMCVTDYAAVRKILEPLGVHLSGHTLVNLSNGTPDEARAMAQWARDSGVRYLDGGIMAVPPMIGSPQALVLYSGCSEAFETHEREIEILGAARFLGVDAGLASLHELALLSAMYGVFGGFLHAAAVIDLEKVKVSEFAGLAVLWITGVTQALPQIAQQIDAGVYSQNVTSSLAMQNTGFDNFVAWSSAQGLRGDLMRPVQRLIAKRVEAGFGAEGIASLIELIRPPCRAHSDGEVPT